jgi:hypothetical protein
MYFLRVDEFPIDRVFISKTKEVLIELMFSKYNFDELVPSREEGVEIIKDQLDTLRDTIKEYQFGKLTIEKSISFEGCIVEKLF